MIQLVVVGDIVMYKPTRIYLAISSGSWTGNPAQKKRPCVVIYVDQHTTIPIVAPLCGAVYINAGWKRRYQMIADWWHPVLFANTGVPVPADGASVQRQPIVITHNPLYAKPPFIPHFKPSYIWAGDSGEWVAHEMLQELESAGGYLRVDAAQLNQLLVWRDHWYHWNRPPA